MANIQWLGIYERQISYVENEISQGDTETVAIKKATDTLVNNNYTYINQPNAPDLRVSWSQTDAENIADSKGALITQADQTNLSVPEWLRRAHKGENLSDIELEKIFKDGLKHGAYLRSNGATDGII